MDPLIFFYKLHCKFFAQMEDHLEDERDMLTSCSRDETDPALRLAYWNGYVANCEMLEQRFVLVVPNEMVNTEGVIASLQRAHACIVDRFVADKLTNKGSGDAMVGEFNELLSKFAGDVTAEYEAAESTFGSQVPNLDEVDIMAQFAVDGDAN